MKNISTQSAPPFPLPLNNIYIIYLYISFLFIYLYFFYFPSPLYPSPQTLINDFHLHVSPLLKTPPPLLSRSLVCHLFNCTSTMGIQLFLDIVLLYIYVI